MKLSGLGADDVAVIDRKCLYSGFLTLWRYTFRHKLFKGGWSTALNREVLIRPPSVGVLLYDPDQDAVLLIEQCRLGPSLGEDDPWLLEIVAGIAEPGESLESVARREIREETNCQVLQLIPVGDFYMSPGITSEKMRLYCGILPPNQASGIFGLENEGEDIKTHIIPFHDAYALITDGQIANAPAVIALQWLKLHHQQLRKISNQSATTG